MTEILLCNRSMQSNQLESQCGVNPDYLLDKFGVTPNIVAGRRYLWRRHHRW
jgi:hypothetical protein